MAGLLRTGTLLVAGLLASLAVCAEEEGSAATVPAMIGQHETSLAALIEFPKGEGNVKVALRCQAKVDEEGTILANACFNGDPEYQKAILKASKKGTLTAAKVNGEPVSVYVLYTVLFVRQGEQQDVIMIPNHGVNSDGFGLQYLSPQRLVGQLEGETSCGTMTYFNTLSGNVGLDGRLSDVTVGLDDERCPACVECIRMMGRESRFVPGFTRSGPAAMMLQEPIYKLRRKPDWFWRASRREPIGNVPEEGTAAKILTPGLGGG